MEETLNSKAAFLWEVVPQLLLFQIPAVPEAICVTQDDQEKQAIRKLKAASGKESIGCYTRLHTHTNVLVAQKPRRNNLIFNITAFFNRS